MDLWKRNLIVLWIGTVVAGISFSLVSPFLPILLQQVGASQNLEMWSGLAFAATFVTSALMAPVWGALADKYGRKMQLLRAGAGIGTTYILMAFATSPYHIVLLRLLLGVFNGFIPSAIAMVATNTPEEHLGSSLGTIQTGGAFGSIMGPLVGGYMSHYFGVQKTLFIAGLVLFGATLICTLGTVEINKGDRNIKTNIIRDIKVAISSPILLNMSILIMVFYMSFMVIQPVLPIYIQQLVPGDPEVPTGIIFSLAGLATVLAAPFWGKRGQRTGYHNVLLIGLFGSATVSILLALSNSIYMLGAMRFVFGLFLASLMPTANAIISKAVPNSFRSRALSLSSSFGQIGAAIGPIIGGYIGGVWSIKVVFIVTAVLIAGIGLWARNKDFEDFHPELLQTE